MNSATGVENASLLCRTRGCMKSVAGAANPACKSGGCIAPDYVSRTPPCDEGKLGDGFHGEFTGDLMKDKPTEENDGKGKAE